MMHGEGGERDGQGEKRDRDRDKKEARRQKLVLCVQPQQQQLLQQEEEEGDDAPEEVRRTHSRGHSGDSQVKFVIGGTADSSVKNKDQRRGRRSWE